jgi:hypothetical protein
MRKSKNKIKEQLAQNEPAEEVPVSLTAEDQQSADPSDAVVQENAPKRKERKLKLGFTAAEKAAHKRTRKADADQEEHASLKHGRKDKKDIPSDAEETVLIQYAGKELDVNELRKKVVAAHIEAGHRAGRINKLTLYIKPEDQKVYYVINDKITGDIDF